MRIGILVALLAAMLVGCVRENASQEAVARADSAVSFRIVLPDEPKPWEKTAAEELEHYLGLCLGGNRLTVEGQGGVVFYVGDTAFVRDNLPPASYQLPTTNYQLSVANLKAFKRTSSALHP